MDDLTPFDQLRILRQVRTSDKCWEWIGTKKTTGYGRVKVHNQTLQAHRVMYEWLVGPIPVGLQLDHLCRNVGCVNPDHLEPVTGRENILRGDGWAAQNARKTHCKNGHEFTEEITRRKNRRTCKICARDAQRRFRARKRFMEKNS